jgi:hypothetical protein
MAHPAEADKASAALTGTSLGGRTLKVNAAKEKVQ